MLSQMYSCLSLETLPFGINHISIILSLSLYMLSSKNDCKTLLRNKKKPDALAIPKYIRTDITQIPEKATMAGKHMRRTAQNFATAIATN